MPVDYRAFCEISAFRVNQEPETYRIILVGDQPKKWMRTGEDFEVADSSSLEQLAQNLVSTLRKFGSPQVVVKNIAQDCISCGRYLGIYEAEFERVLNANELSQFCTLLQKYWTDVEEGSK